VTYCVNPWCNSRQNDDDAENCAACGQALLVNGRFRVISSILLADRSRRCELLKAIDTRGSYISPQNSIVALKTLIDDDPKIVELFHHEATSLRNFDHPGIPRSDIDDLFTFQVSNGDVFDCYAMSFVEGVNLEDWIKSHGAIAQQQALDWLKQLAEILREIHTKGFFHRDIKPSNIMLKPDGQLVLIDFGAVRQFGDTYLAKLARNGYGLTQVHTLGYSPPEQMNGKAIPQSDFYALGRTLIYCVTGKSFMEIPIDAQTGDMLWQAEAQHIDPPLISLLETLIQPVPKDRPHDAQSILTSISVVSVAPTKKSIKPRTKLPIISPLICYAAIVGFAIVLLLGLGSRMFNAYVLQQILLSATAQPNSQEWRNLKSNLDQSIANRPSARAYNEFGQLCRNMKDIDCAEQQFKKAINLQPKYLDPYMRLGNLYEDTGQFEEAKIIYQRAANTTQDTTPYINLSRLNLLFKNLEEAEQDLKKAQAQGTTKKVYSTLKKNQAWLSLERNNFEDTKKYADIAISLDSQYASPYCLGALASKRLGKPSLDYAKGCMMPSLDTNFPEVLSWREKLVEK
jgi:serine/threonine protein kinase